MNSLLTPAISAMRLNDALRTLLESPPPGTFRNLCPKPNTDPTLKRRIESVLREGLLIEPGGELGAAAAGVWLVFDFLEESHTLSQSIHTPLGSYLHAMMHRLEGDYSNSKYWLHRAGTIPAFATLSARVGDLVRPRPVDRMLHRLLADGWNPGGFVDLVARCVDDPLDTNHALCLQIQLIEWQCVMELALCEK